MPTPPGHDPRPGPLAYLLTFTCYGTRLHGGAPYRLHRTAAGTIRIPEDPQRETWRRWSLRQPPYHLDAPRRRQVLAAIQSTATYRNWTLHAAHVRADHVHAVITAPQTPERVLNILKAYASRQLNQAGFDSKDRLRWTRHGSTRYLNTEQALIQAIRYTLHQSGPPMAHYPN